MNKTTIVAATVALSAAALGLVLWLNVPKQPEPMLVDTTQLPTPNPKGHPELDRAEKTRVDFAHKSKIGAVQAAVNKAVNGSNN